jgi:hypothetical protein
MIDAGDGEHGDEGGAINGAAEDPEKVIPQGSQNDAAQKNHDTQSTAHNVGDHIHQFFSPGVGGKNPSV